ncbi:MAG: histidinol-phosphate transaminase [Polyangiaceae bacterium]|nr:histidinol-phosphate transaminase [Polyangiaceae bacterium]
MSEPGAAVDDVPRFALSELLRPELSELRPYAPAQGDFAVRLDANEAPPLLSVEARERLAAAAAATAWERYPDATAHRLREAIARRAGVEPDRVLVGTGSDEVICTLLTALARPRGRHGSAAVVTTTPTFVMYRASARARGLRVVEVPLDAAWHPSLPALERAIELAAPNLVFLASPNNPTGTVASRETLAALAELARGALLVVDEAYVDYASGDARDLLESHENVALLRTLSKVGFAALRVGWLLGRPELVHELDKVRPPYDLPTVSQELARVALDELSGEISRVVAHVVEERARLERALAALPGVVVTPSHANFVWLRTERPASELYAALAARGVLVRSFHARGGRLAHQLRVTVGTRDEDDAFLSAFSELLR